MGYHCFYHKWDKRICAFLTFQMNPLEKPMSTPLLIALLASPKCDYITSTEMEMDFKEDCTLPPADSLLFVNNCLSFSDEVTSH